MPQKAAARNDEGAILKQSKILSSFDHSFDEVEEILRSIKQGILGGGKFENRLKSSKMLSNKDIQSFEQNRNLEGAKPISICTTSNNEDLHGEKDEDDVELVQLLLLCAQMIGQGKYDHASAVLRKQCKCQKKTMSFLRGNPTQRLSYYVSATLQERIEL